MGPRDIVERESANLVYSIYEGIDATNADTVAPGGYAAAIVEAIEDSRTDMNPPTDPLVWASGAPEGQWMSVGIIEEFRGVTRHGRIPPATVSC